MKVVLNKEAIDHAQMLINHREVDINPKNWAECAPTIDEIDHYLDTHDMEEFGEWYLGKNHQVPQENKDHYMYPVGDLKLVHKSALLQSRAQAEKAGHKEIAQAASQLLDYIDKGMAAKK